MLVPPLLVALVVAVSAVQDAPQQVRLAFRGTGFDFAVSWTTNSATSTSVTQYGLQSGVYSSQVTGTQSK